MKPVRTALLASAALIAGAGLAQGQTTVTIATVNNADMVVMQELSSEFEAAHPDIRLNWVILEENVLRQRLTTDIATGGGQFDVMTIGLFEAPMWGERGWLAPFDDVPDAYDLDDVLASIRDGLSHDGVLYALPFYAESQMTFYRSDLFEAAGLTMPDQPTWHEIAEFAAEIHDPDNGVYGICLRGKPGWGENMGQITPVVNSFGGRWFDMDWVPQLDSPEWLAGVTFYVDLLRTYGPPGASSNGYNETLALFATGRCGIWVDATVSAGFLTDPNQSVVVDTVAYAPPPYAEVPKGHHYLWSWALAVPASSQAVEEAREFIYWATSRDYIELVGETGGWGTVPPGTRRSTYEDQRYLDAAPFATLTLEAIETADPTDPTVEPVPYRGISYVGIPEFQAFGTSVGQAIAAAISGQQTVEQALATAQAEVERTMVQAGYLQR